jgi:S-adenosylmethionine:tRNA ribosyltransferase-isomerase
VHTDDFDFALPNELIAQNPPENRGDSRLLLVERHGERLVDGHFTDLPQSLRAGDVLVLNASAVIPARLLGKKVATGGVVELLLLRPVSAEPTALALEAAPDAFQWRVLGQASKPIRIGARVQFGGDLQAEVLERLGLGEFIVQFSASTKSLQGALSEFGQIPLPPYVTRAPTAQDHERYQTVFASNLGSVAAPTAGLHFTSAMLQGLRALGVEIHTLSLDIGPGTFRPVREGDIAKHVMHEERYCLEAAVVEAVTKAKRESRRVVAVGTTVVRALESAARQPNGISVGPSATSIFISPGFDFQVVDALLTNFHLPKSTLLMLVSAFATRERMLRAYRHAVEGGYRFFSYGDAMFIA